MCRDIYYSSWQTHIDHDTENNKLVEPGVSANHDCRPSWLSIPFETAEDNLFIPL